MRTLALLLTLALPLLAGAQPAAPGAAGAGPNLCGECRKNVGAEAQKCESAAKTPDDRAACTKKFAEANRSCDAGACKGVAPQPANACTDCQRRASIEAQRCVSLPPGQDLAGCKRRAEEFKKGCMTGSCKVPATK